jgi:hypothetical protein
MIGNAVHVMRIATGEIEEKTPVSEGKEWRQSDSPSCGFAEPAGSLRDVMAPAPENLSALADLCGKWIELVQLGPKMPGHVNYWHSSIGMEREPCH